MSREFHGKLLDPFQEKAISELEAGFSVVVSAPTGSGKTLIAEYAIEEALHEGLVAVYTAPIKALSNQKYRDFCEEYGEEKIGILTGDVVVNPTAPILIMTTEVYRNMVLTHDPLVEQVKYLIMDEVHYINDRERGTVWEESIIFSPESVRFLCLSATIPNSREFADWIESIKHHQVKVVKHHHRPVPLTHLFYDLETGITNFDGLKDALEHTQYPTYMEAMRSRRRSRHRGKGSQRRRERNQRDDTPQPRHEDLVKILVGGGDVPCLFFVFSRARTEKMAHQLSRRSNFLTREEQAESTRIVRRLLDGSDPQIHELDSMRNLRKAVSHGIGFHHAGLLPKLKEIVEHLFGEGLIKVLYATETFAVGINMPAKVVCFEALRKYDGITHRFLKTKEYYQLAGRAGRRGMDKEGKAISMIDRRTLDINKLARLTKGDDEPLESQFHLSYNTVLNMILHHPTEEIDVLLKSNFGYFQSLHGKRERVLTRQEFEKKKKELQKLDFLDRDNLTEKGWFAAHIYSHELLVGELFSGYFHKHLSSFQIALLIASITYEEGKRERFKPLRKNRDVARLISLIRDHPYADKHLPPRKISKMSRIMWMWFSGCQFTELLETSTFVEGDFIRLFRQTIDLLTQIRKASDDQVLLDKINEAIDALDREFVAVTFD